MNEHNGITERIDKVLNILNNGNFHGYEQWSVIVDTMRELAGISQEIRKLEATEKPKEEKNGGD